MIGDNFRPVDSTAVDTVVALDARQDTPHKTVARIISRVAAEYCVSSATLLGKDLPRKLYAARLAAILAVIDRFPGYSTPRLGRIFRRDHSTILHYLHKAGIRRGLKYQGKQAKRRDARVDGEAVGKHEKEMTK